MSCVAFDVGLVAPALAGLVGGSRSRKDCQDAVRGSPRFRSFYTLSLLTFWYFWTRVEKRSRERGARSRGRDERNPTSRGFGGLSNLGVVIRESGDSRAGVPGWSPALRGVELYGVVVSTGGCGRARKHADSSAHSQSGRVQRGVRV